MFRTHLLIVALVATTGCNALRNLGNKEEVDCWPDRETTEYALDAMLPLGFTGQEAIDTLLGERNIEVLWEDDSTEPATLLAQPSSETVSYTFYPEVTEDCVADTADTAVGHPSWLDEKSLSFTGTLQIVTTESSNLNESIEVSFGMKDLETAGAQAWWASPEFAGDYQAPTCGECESVGLNVRGGLTPTSSSGTITIEGQMPWRYTQIDTGYAPEPEPVILATINWN